MGRREDLRRSEDQGWAELRSLLDALSPQQMLEPGLTSEGWTVKDLMWHLGAWWAEAGNMLEQIKAGTYRALDDWQTDEKNARFLEEGRRLDLPTVKAELFSARNRGFLALAVLPEVTQEAEEWFTESGALHYRDHMEDLRAWVGTLTSPG